MNDRSSIKLSFLLSPGESLFIKIDFLKESLNALFSQHKIEKLLKLLLLCSCNNRWSGIADGLYATLFPVKGDNPICSPDRTFEWCFVLKHLICIKIDTNLCIYVIMTTVVSQKVIK